MTLIELNSTELKKSVCDHKFSESGVYVIENDGMTSVAESIADFFPFTDMNEEDERNEVFDEYAEILIDSNSYIEIPEKLS